MEEDNKPMEDSCITACDVLENGSKSISEESAQVTKEMVEEEERVYRAALAEEKVVRQKFMADLQTLQRDNFYFHLKNLLDRSFWYTSSLHRRIMEENEQETSENTGKETNKISSGKDQGISEQVVPGKSVQGGGSEEGRGSERSGCSEPQQSQTVPPGSDPLIILSDDSAELSPARVKRRKDTSLPEKIIRRSVRLEKSESPSQGSVVFPDHTRRRKKPAQKDCEIIDSSQQSSDDITIKCDSSQSTTAERSELSSPPQLNCDSQNGGPVSVHRQPVLVTGGTLRSYQVDGFKWLKTLYENGVNSILADEMGLGKTVQCVALVAELIGGGISGPFLVCAPLSTVANWMSEFATFAPKVKESFDDIPTELRCLGDLKNSSLLLVQEVFEVTQTFMLSSPVKWIIATASFTIPCILYHGSKMERLAMQSKIKMKHEVDGLERQTRPVVITSYEIAMNDQSMLRTNSFSLMIVDEGHRIKNRQCKLIKVLNTFDSTHRLLLTGTPLQNNLSELWSLLNFLIPEIFDNLGSFQAWFDVEFLATAEDAYEQIIQEEQRKSTLTMLHKILTPFMLRRLKCDVDFVIPPKKELLVFAPLAPRQREMYEAIVNRTIVHLLEPNKVEKVDEPVKLDAKGRPVRRVRKKSLDLKLLYKSELSRRENDDDILRWAEAVQHSDELEDISTEDVVEKPKSDVPIVRLQLRNLLALLRNCCNHPYLIEFPIEDDEYRIDEDLVTTSGKLLLLDRILFELKKRGHKVLIFSQSTQMLNVLEHYCYLRQHCFCRLDGTMSLTDRRLQISRFADDDVFLFLLSTRAGGLGINLTSADTVIIYDSDWNPQCDLQAQDRCHRIGQTRPVVVYRLVTANTVDQQIVERATAKRTLERLVIHKENFKSASNSFAYQNKPLSPEELLAILKETDYKKFAEQSMDRAINDEDLELLLDRSDLHEIWKKRLEGEPVVCEKLSPNGRQELFQVLADVSERKE